MDQHVGSHKNPNVSVDTALKVELIREEFEELKVALEGKDKHGNALSTEQQLIAVADALGDLTYVVTGAAVAWGIDLDSVVREIHKSNMTKASGPRREDGKRLKGPDYKPPNIATALSLHDNHCGFVKDPESPHFCLVDGCSLEVHCVQCLQTGHIV